MRIAIVFNPRSGSRAAASALSTVVAALASHNHTLEVIDCAAEPAFEAELSAKATQFDRVIAIGGDGTLNGVVNAIVLSANPALPVAFVPTGRGKDTARSLPSWKPTALAGGAFEQAESHPVDLIRITLANGRERVGVNVCSIGLGARAAQAADTLPRWFGSVSYVLGAVRGFTATRPFPLALTLDGKTHEIDNTLALAVCNGKSFGGGIYLAPEAGPSDGVLEVVAAHNANLGDFAALLPKLRSGKPYQHPAVTRMRGTRIEIEPMGTVLSEVDGELLSAQPIRLEIMPAALQWIAP